MAATLIDIARAAGVSPATVSRALADSPLIKKATKDRIRRLAAEADYRPNRLARSLLTGKTQTLGFVVAKLSNPYFAEAAEALHRAARERGYDLLTALTDAEFDRVSQQMERLLDRHVDGILVWDGLPRRDDSAIQRLRERQIAHVGLARPVEDPQASFIAVDRPAGMEQAVEHLTRRGITRMSYVGNDAGKSTPHGQTKYEGFLAALQRRGLEPVRCLRCPSPGPAARSARAIGFEAGCTLAEERPYGEAILCLSDEVAMGVIRGLHSRGLAVPRDVAVVGFDGIAEGEFSIPSLTTIAQPIDEIARRGIEIVLQLIEDPTAAPQRILLPPTLVVRDSSGATPNADHAAVPAAERHPGLLGHVRRKQ